MWDVTLAPHIQVVMQILAVLSDVSVQPGTCGMTLSAAGKLPDTSSNAILAVLSDVSVRPGTCGMTLSAAGKLPDRG